MLFDEAGRSITFKCADNELSVADDDIRTVQVTLPPPLTNGSPVWFPWQEYCYAVITTSAGKQFLITCLAVPGLRWPYEFKNAEVLESLYCWPPEVH